MNHQSFLIALLLLACLFASTTAVPAADLIGIQPLTEQIVVLHFDEGHIDYFGIYQDRYNGNRIYYERLNLSKAMATASYSIISPDDGNYRLPQTPVAIGRKSKGVDFNNLYEPAEPKAILHHWIYLEFPYPLQQGRTYTVMLTDFAANVNEYTFNFNWKQLRSPTVHVNQIGFTPQAPKYAYLSHFMGSFNTAKHPNGALNLDDYDHAPFHIVRMADDSVVFSGKISKQRDKNDRDFQRTEIDFTHANMTRADVWQCDFSAFATPGEYRVVVERMGCSYPFEIYEDVYREPYYYTSRALFTQRQGIIQEIEPGFLYPRDHHPDDGTIMKYFPELIGEGEFNPAKAAGTVYGVTGWYHDAGDWDGYASHYRVPMTLLTLYDLKPENFGDGDIGARYKLSPSGDWIDEGKNGIPDLLDEAMWLIKFYRLVKDTLKAQGFSDGGVPGYVGVDACGDGGIPSWEDKRILALKGGDAVMMTYHYAACAAYLAICLDKFQGSTHPDSPTWINEARDAYAWAYRQNKDHDGEVNRAKMEAAAALYRCTGETKFQDDFRTCKNRDNQWKSRLWFNIQPWHYAATIFALIADGHPGLDVQLKRQCIQDIVDQATYETVATAEDRGFRYGLDRDIPFMLGTFSTPHIYLAAVAHYLTGEQKFLDACYTTCDFCLGGNQMDLVKVSGLGENPEHQPFHPDSWYLIDYNSKVYTNPALPGYVLYEMHRTGDWFNGAGWNWVGDEDFSRSTAFPSIEHFPDAEARFANRNSIAGSEFTIHQTQVMAIFAYGYLCSHHRGAFTPNERPTVALNLVENQPIKKDTTITLTVTASPDVRRVEYYYDWHFIGESCDQANQFAFQWHLSRYKISLGRQLITAKAYDDRGLESKPTDKGSVTVIIHAPTLVPKQKMGQPWHFQLYPNYPNPFHPRTLIAFSLPADDLTRLEIYNTLGERVATLVDGKMPLGYHTVEWDGFKLPAGIYYSKLQQQDKMEVKKLVVLK